MAYEEIAPGVYAQRVFSREEAADVVSAAELSPFWHPAFVNADQTIDTSLRDAEVLFEQVHQPHAQLYRQRLAIATHELALALAPRSALIEVQLVRYRPGGHYANHRDAPPDGPVVRTVSLVAYLNDDFEGGELVFPELEYSVAPQAGIAIVFPPHLLHRAEPIASGTKYAITAWYHAI